jgi:hypothetical protein
LVGVDVPSREVEGRAISYDDSLADLRQTVLGNNDCIEWCDEDNGEPEIVSVELLEDCDSSAFPTHVVCPDENGVWQAVTALHVEPVVDDEDEKSSWKI